MRRAVAGLIALMVGVALLTPVPSAGGEETLDGTWEGTWRTRSGSGRLVLRLTQTGQSVRGDYDADGGPAGSLRGMRVHGTLKGDRLELRTYTSNRAFEGRLEGNSLAGTYWGTRAVKSFDVRRADPTRADRRE